MTEHADAQIKQALEALKNNPALLEGVEKLDGATVAAAVSGHGIELDEEAVRRLDEVLAEQSPTTDGEIGDDVLERVSGGVAWGEAILGIIDKIF